MANTDPPRNKNNKKAANSASRATFLEARRVLQPYNVHMDFGRDATHDRPPVIIRYLHRRTRRYCRAFAAWSGWHEDATRTDQQKLADFLNWATPEERDLSGPLLGCSGRVDGLQGCDVDKIANTEGDRSPSRDNLSLVLWHPNGPLGTLGKLPKELRCEVYKHAFPHTFWQCYHTKRDGFTLLDISHSSRLPALFNTSKAIREEVLESAHCDTRPEIIVGTDVVALNLPLLIGMQAGQTLDGNRAKLPASKELFVGIQVPSPPGVCDTVALRVNVGKVVDLINVIAANGRVPPIRVSFKTNQETSSLQYYGSDFEIFMGPLSKLRITRRDSDMKPRQPLVIDRLPPYSSSDRRNDTCDTIELAVRDPLANVTQFPHRQHMIELKLELTAYFRHRATQKLNLDLELSRSSLYGLVVEHVTAASKKLLAFFETRNDLPPRWIHQIYSQCKQHDSIEEAAHAKFLDSIISAFPDTCDRLVESWFNGRSSKADPF